MNRLLMGSALICVTVSIAWAQAAPSEAAAKAAKEPGAQVMPSGLVYRSLKEGNGPSPQASDKVRVHYRGKKKDGEAPDFSTMSVLDLAPTPSQAHALGDEQRIVLEGLRRIPLEYQTALELFYWEELPVVELAEVLDVPVGTVKTRLRRGRQLLEQKIGELAASSERLQTTLTNLDEWAKSLREKLQRDDPDT